MKPAWYRKRRYKHFDHPVSDRFIHLATEVGFAQKHAFSPLIKYLREQKRYKRAEKQTVIKIRPIMYASHRDACILSYYASLLNVYLDKRYDDTNISESVIAYRALGRANYHFAADAYHFAKENSPVKILAFDVTGFFDNLDHLLLKNRLKNLLSVDKLNGDWYAIYKYMTNFHYIDLDDLKSHHLFGERIRDASARVIGRIAEIKKNSIEIKSNPKLSAGIPQGTPISAALSNLYMIDFDVAIRRYCDSIGAMYRRYSDDILIICKEEHAADAEISVISKIAAEKLELSGDKTEKTLFSSNEFQFNAQYLGFSFGQDGAFIRASSLSRQWRKMRQSFRKTITIATSAIAAGNANKIYTKKLRRRFTALQFRNFSSYGRRSAKAFNKSEKIRRQIRRFEREVNAKLEAIKLAENELQKKVETERLTREAD
ncbi:reverse transcriptase/maturase family protein [Roseomonas mucosa]